MAKNNFSNIRTFRQLTKTRQTLDAEVQRQADQLWIPFAVAIINAVRSALRRKKS